MSQNESLLHNLLCFIGVSDHKSFVKINKNRLKLFATKGAETKKKGESW